MHCNGCSSDLAARVRVVYDDKEKRTFESCDICSKLAAVWLPDVYLGTKGGVQTDENLCGKDGKPIPFSTKREKAAIMNMLNVRQANCAEHQNGSRTETKRKTFII